jgi:cell division protein FtsI/penicillin-binding protein 2
VEDKHLPPKRKMSRCVFDNVQDYVETLLEEHFDRFDVDERKGFWNNVIQNYRVRPLLKELAYDLLEEHTGKILVSAILNSCNWDDVYQYVRDYIEKNYDSVDTMAPL